MRNTDTVLINNKKATWRDWYALAVKNYLRYKQFDSCTMMNTYRRFLGKGFYNDFFVDFLLQADEVPFAIQIIKTTTLTYIIQKIQTGE